MLTRRIRSLRQPTLDIVPSILTVMTTYYTTNTESVTQTRTGTSTKEPVDIETYSKFIVETVTRTTGVTSSLTTTSITTESIEIDETFTATSTRQDVASVTTTPIVE